MRTALIVGVAGTKLSRDEAQFLKDARPAGFILFARNLKDHDQIRALVADVRAAVGADDLLVLIDQEGGRVQRLRPPLGRALPPAAAYGALYARDPAAAVMAAFEATRLLAADLAALGINTDCAPVLDLPVAGAHDIIGDRAYGTTRRSRSSRWRKAVADGFMAGGILPVIKHIPGHGRATADSHLALPVVTETRAELTATDFAPFKALSHMPAAMTAHVVFRAIDADAPASTSADRDARDHPRRDRLRRPLDERRPHHEGAVGPHARARRVRDRRRLRPGAPLQRRSGRDAAGGRRLRRPGGPRRSNALMRPLI